MNVIWKFTLNNGFSTMHTIPASDFKFLAATYQRNKVRVWLEATIQSEQDHIDVAFLTLPTGSTVPEGYTYGATVYTENIAFVHHIYYRKILK